MIKINSLTVSDSNAILVGEFDGFIWIRCEGKGSFLNSPLMKSWTDKKLSDGCERVVVDLEVCKGMDSTFMGTLAGMAMKLAKVPNGKMEVVSASDRNTRSLDDLGLSALMEISSGVGHYADRVDDLRGFLVESKSGPKADRTKHVFDAHKKLCEADDDNNDKFSTVLDCLEAELSNRKPTS